MTTRIVPTTLSCPACESLPAGTRCPERCARNFVLSSWSSSFKPSRDAGMITADDWVSVMHPQIAKICARPECRVLVATGDPRKADYLADMYMGFIAGEPSENIVYYCCVKEAYRRHGIARALFAALGIDPHTRFVYPCDTRSTSELRRKIPYAIRDVAVARYPKPERHRRYA